MKRGRKLRTIAIPRLHTFSVRRSQDGDWTYSFWLGPKHVATVTGFASREEAETVARDRCEQVNALGLASVAQTFVEGR